MEKIFVDKQNTASFRCPHCGFIRQFDASSYRDKDSRIQIKCQCGETVPVLIEFRKFFRKSVQLYGQGNVESTLTGHCEIHRTREKFSITILDLSFEGMRFSLAKEYTQGSADLVLDDVLTISFRLDNQTRDLVERKAVVRNVYNGSYGVSFSRTEYDKDLGFYLLR